MKAIMKTQIGLILVNGILYLIYARKSSEDKRQTASIPDQLPICHRIEELLGIKVPEEYIFTDSKTAMKSNKRVNFNKMKFLIDAAIAQDIKVVIISWEAARLARNNEEGGYLVDRVRDEQIKIYTQDSGNYDHTNYTTLNLHFGSSSEYSKKTSLGVKKNMLGKVEKGICPTAAHLGYMFNPSLDKGEKNVVKGKNWDKCREWVELMLTGLYNIEESLGIMTARGLYANKIKGKTLKPVSKSKAYTFFNDIYNTGMFYFHSELHQGSHPPLMTMAEFKKIRNIIEKRGGKKPETGSLPHIGIFDCGCGCGSKVTGGKHTRHYLNGNSQEFNFYHSTRKDGKCKEQAVPEREMEAQIANYIDHVEMVPEFLEWLKKVIKRQNKIMYQHEVKEQELQSKRLAEITRKKYELKDMKNEGFFPNDEEYQKQKTDLLQQEQLLRQEVATTDSSVWDSLFEDMCNFSQRVKELYNSDDPNIKRMVVEIIGLNFTIKDKKLRIKAKNAWIALHWVKKQLWEKNLIIEPQIMLSEEPKRVIADPSVLYGARERS